MAFCMQLCQSPHPHWVGSLVLRLRIYMHNNEVKALLHTKPPVKCHSAVKYHLTNQIHTSEIPQTANCYVRNCSRLLLPLWVGSLVYTWNCWQLLLSVKVMIG